MFYLEYSNVFVLGISSVHVSYGVGQAQREQGAHHLNTSNPNSDSSDSLVPRLVQVADLGRAADGVGGRDLARVDQRADDAAPARAARVREAQGEIVGGAVAAAAFQLNLNVREGLPRDLVGLGGLEHVVHGLVEGFTDALRVDEQKHRQRHLHDDDHEQEDRVRDDHAMALPDSAAAAEEGDHKHDRAEHYEQPRRHRQVALLQDLVDEAPVQEHGHADAHHGQADERKQQIEEEQHIFHKTRTTTHFDLG